MNYRINDNGSTAQADLLRRRIAERIDAKESPDGMEIVLSIDALVPLESYRIDKTASGWKITAGDGTGLYHGVGKFLHSAVWTCDSFTPKETDGVVIPECPFRCIYFSVHFHNWYYEAPMADIERYLEDMVMYGFNTMHVIVPVPQIKSLEDDVFQNAAARTRAIFMAAKRAGMKVMFGIDPNQGLATAPHEFDADQHTLGRYRGKLGRNLCPNKPGCLEYLRGIWIKCLEQYEDIGLDYVMVWPYDEGGCSCEQCAPWGANGFEKLARLVHKDAKRMYPNVKLIYSTWAFDTDPVSEHEYETLYKRLGDGEMDYVTYLMTDAHGDYPKFVLDHPVVKPVVNFPEISMWGLGPWGGFGANPLPKRFERIWNSAKAVLSGGDPYSEGIFEDISKIQFAGYYWKKDARYQDVLGEYAAYEFGEAARFDAVKIMENIEKNHVIAAEASAFFRDHPGHEDEYTKPTELDMEAAKEARRLAEELDAKLPPKQRASWRWRILYIRAILDEKRYSEFLKREMKFTYPELYILRHDAPDAQLLSDDPEAQELYKELRRIFRTLDHDNGMNKWTLPVVQGQN